MVPLKTSSGDTIIDAIHRTRQQMAEKFGGDIAAILEDARKRQEASGLRRLASSNVEQRVKAEREHAGGLSQSITSWCLAPPHSA